MTEREKLLDVAFRAPHTIPETEPESEVRETAKRQYFSVNYESTRSAYDAGWKAAKAYYNVQDQPPTIS